MVTREGGCAYQNGPGCPFCPLPMITRVRSLVVTGYTSYTCIYLHLPMIPISAYPYLHVPVLPISTCITHTWLPLPITICPWVPDAGTTGRSRTGAPWPTVRGVRGRPGTPAPSGTCPGTQGAMGPRACGNPLRATLSGFQGHLVPVGTLEPRGPEGACRPGIRCHHRTRPVGPEVTKIPTNPPLCRNYRFVGGN
jgi:hypothetical protein